MGLQRDEHFDAAVAEARCPRPIDAAHSGRLMMDVSGIPGACRLPQALRVLLENVVRRAPDDQAAAEQAWRVVSAGLQGQAGQEVDFTPSRVLFQDFTGVPVFVDFAAMRDAMAERGGDPALVNPRVPCVLVVDHSVCADCFGSPEAAGRNLAIEAERNRERFAFLKWAAASFRNVTIVPPGQGICHQLNVEHFSPVVGTDTLWGGEGELACFDTLVGSDSHTTTANGLGVLGWGVGGIEAEAAALGQSLPMRVPEVVELRLEGELPQDASAMDLALACAALLRDAGVVGSVVEVTGPGVQTLTVPQRACVANMSPEYGSTAVLFPADRACFDYLRLTGRDAAQVGLAEAFCAAQRHGVAPDPVYGRTVTLDLGGVRPALAGPSRPHNWVDPAGLQERFRQAAERNGHGDLGERFSVELPQGTFELGHGTLAIAALTSCTTATDPAMMVAAGIVARRALAAGLAPRPWVKTVLAPGSHATLLLLQKAGFLEPLAALGFAPCGYGCMVCIGNSGPVVEGLAARSRQMELTSVLSGNRNFDGRISPAVAQNYLASPALVVAYSLVGTVDVDLASEPVGIGRDGEEVWLADLLPTRDEVEAELERVLAPEVYAEGTDGLLEGDDAWQRLPSRASGTYPWDDASTYIKRPPYFDDARPADVWALDGARCLVRLGDFVTTDHISPAGAIAPGSPAAAYLTAHGQAPEQFNTYGSRRGNHEVMERGTFANIRLQNRLAEGEQGCVTRNLLTGQMTSVWGAAEAYAEAQVPLVVVAGKMYGSGSSRDWAAKGPGLQGVRAVIAESFERIHRSNLVGMGIVPLELVDATADGLGLDGTEVFSAGPVDFSCGLPADPVTLVRATRRDGETVEFPCRVRVDTATEAAYLRSGGILPYVLENLRA